MLPLPGDAFEARRVEQRRRQLALARAIRPQRLLGPDRVRPPRRDRASAVIETVAHPLRHRARRHPPARLGHGAHLLRLPPLPGVVGAKARRARLRPAARAAGSCRRASRLLRRRLEADLGHSGTREFIKVLRLMEHATPRRARPARSTRRSRSARPAPTPSPDPATTAPSSRSGSSASTATRTSSPSPSSRPTSRRLPRRSTAHQGA